MALITELDDRTLVELHRAGDDDAFRRIVVRHHRALYANALRRLGDPVLAEDAVQDAFLRAFRNLDRFDGDYHLDAWLHRILTNTCHDIGRRRGRDSRLFARACTEVEVEAPAADDSYEAMPREQVAEALDSLPETYREVLLLRFVDEMSYSDVAQKAGISEENARARVSRGRNMLKRMLSGTSGLLVWAIAPLRRTQSQLSGAEAEAASQVTSHAQTLTAVTNVVSTAPSAPASGISQLSTLVAQAGPAIAQAAPTVTSSAPTFGKAAVAVGIAASVAIPTGVAVERARTKPAPVAAPVIDDEASAAPDEPVTVTTTAPAPSTPQTSVVGALGASAPAIVGDAVESSTSTTIESTTSTTDTTDQGAGETTTTAPPATPTDGGTAPPAEEPPAEEEPPPPAPAVSGELKAGSLTVTEAGPRVELSGPLSLAIGDRTITGTLAGKVLIGEADQKDPEAPRQVEGSLQLTFEDGNTAELRFAGTAVAYAHGQSQIDDLVVRFALEGGQTLGLAESGELRGRLETRKGTGSLTVTIPGAPADDSSGA